jgi:hypothetical protein
MSPILGVLAFAALFISFGIIARNRHHIGGCGSCNEECGDDSDNCHLR